MRLLLIFVSSIVLGFSANMFLLPHEILAGGVTGIAMMLGLVTPLNAG
ncbi:MAG: YitT family protein, partial [Planococcus donghaensis]